MTAEAIRPVARHQPWYKILYVQVLIAILLGVLIGYFFPDLGKNLKPLGDGFIALIKMMIAPANNHISVLKGNLAPESCLLKLSGKTLEKGEFRGTARVFESEADTMAFPRWAISSASDVSASNR